MSTIGVYTPPRSGGESVKMGWKYTPLGNGVGGSTPPPKLPPAPGGSFGSVGGGVGWSTFLSTNGENVAFSGHLEALFAKI